VRLNNAFCNGPDIYLASGRDGKSQNYHKSVTRRGQNCQWIDRSGGSAGLYGLLNVENLASEIGAGCHLG
jgi:hypothetical protein